MVFFGHKKHATLFKSVLAILYVSLLGSQLSIKFYLCANSPAGIFRFEHRQTMERKQANAGFASFFKHRKHASFSLDKRYHFKHFVVLLSPEFHCLSAVCRHKAQTLLNECAFINASAGNNPRRGPPAV